MNPFPNLGKPLLSSWISANSQSANYPNNHAPASTERPKSAGPYNLPDFHATPPADPKNLARPPPSYESYIHPNKRIRHNPLEFSEVHREPLTIPNQVRSGGRLEDQIQMQMQHGNKPSDESFMPQHPGMRKLPGNLPFGLQESGNFGTGANNANALFLKQQMEKSKKDLGLGESAQNTAPFNFQNEGLYNPVANNYGLANLLLNSYPNNVPMLELLQQQYQAKVQQLANFMQLNQLNQLLLNQQDLSKGNTLLRNTNLADPNNSLLRIPPLDSQSLFNYLAASSATPNNLGALFRTETGEKLRDSLAASEALKNLPLNIGLDKMEMSHMNKKTEPKLEEMHPLEMKSEGLIRGEDFQYKDPSILIRDEGTEHSLIDLAAQRRKNNQLQQRMTNMVNLAPFMKEPKDRRKNKWQMMLEQDDDFPSLKVSPFEKVGKGSKLMRADKRGFMSLSALQGKPTDVENYEELQGTMDAGSGRLLSFSQRKKKGENFSRSNGKFKNLQGKNRLLTEAQLYQGTYLNFNSLNDSDERGVNRMSITSSYGRTIDELTMDENDQKTVDTRFGPEYQAQILDLDLNASNTLVKRIPKQVWDPEAVEEKALTAYFDKLQSILNCKAINEEKAIRMLVKKNMIQEEVVVTIKKNEKFYSSFLGVSHTDKHSKHKKGR